MALPRFQPLFPLVRAMVLATGLATSTLSHAYIEGYDGNKEEVYLLLNLSVLGTPRNVAGKPIDPTDQNRNDGFSPKPTPALIATYPIHGGALAISEGIEKQTLVTDIAKKAVAYGVEGVRVQHLGPEIAVICRGIAVAGEDIGMVVDNGVAIARIAKVDAVDNGRAGGGIDEIVIQRRLGIPEVLLHSPALVEPVLQLVTQR